MAHCTTCGIISYYHSIGFMLCCSITHPSLYLTIPQGSKCILNTHTENNTDYNLSPYLKSAAFVASLLGRCRIVAHMSFLVTI